MLLLCLLALAACGETEPGPMTLEDVRALAEKGEQLTWSDCDAYEGAEVGSGLYILAFPIQDAENLHLLIGGPSLEMDIWYAYLQDADDDEDRIDIRYDDLDVFLEAHLPE